MGVRGCHSIKEPEDNSHSYNPEAKKLQLLLLLQPVWRPLNTAGRAGDRTHMQSMPQVKTHIALTLLARRKNNKLPLSVLPYTVSRPAH